MRVIKIKSEKQDNGHWGMPFNVSHLSECPLTDNDQTNLLQSAIIVAVAEQTREKFSLSWFSDTSFVITFPEREKNSICRVHYNKYFLDDKTLYEFDNEDERTVFLRKKKIEEIERQ